MILEACRSRACSAGPAAPARWRAVLKGGSFVLIAGHPSRSSQTTISAAAMESTAPRSSRSTALLEQRKVSDTGRQATRFATSPRRVPLCTRMALTATNCARSSIFRDEAGGCVARSLQARNAGSAASGAGSSNSRPRPPGSEKTTSRRPRCSRQQRSDLDQRRGSCSETSDRTQIIESEGTAASRPASGEPRPGGGGGAPGSWPRAGSARKQVPRRFWA
mmetsp:Transcript_144340/g.448201  ORF Transcript_144340/g.448201 Transcript_144340/m.448201 type:complete len:220 (-) Transcript_144340:75-734(-)